MLFIPRVGYSLIGTVLTTTLVLVTYGTTFFAEAALGLTVNNGLIEFNPTEHKVTQFDFEALDFGGAPAAKIHSNGNQQARLLLKFEIRDKEYKKVKVSSSSIEKHLKIYAYGDGNIITKNDDLRAIVFPGNDMPKEMWSVNDLGFERTIHISPHSDYLVEVDESGIEKRVPVIEDNIKGREVDLNKINNSLLVYIRVQDAFAKKNYCVSLGLQSSCTDPYDNKFSIETAPIPKKPSPSNCQYRGSINEFHNFKPSMSSRSSRPCKSGQGCSWLMVMDYQFGETLEPQYVKVSDARIERGRENFVDSEVRNAQYLTSRSHSSGYSRAMSFFVVGADSTKMKDIDFVSVNYRWHRRGDHNEWWMGYFNGELHQSPFTSNRTQNLLPSHDKRKLRFIFPYIMNKNGDWRESDDLTPWKSRPGDWSTDVPKITIIDQFGSPYNYDFTSNGNVMHCAGDGHPDEIWKIGIRR